MLSAICMLVAAFPEVPRLDLSCVLAPSKSHMAITCLVDVPAQYVKDGKVVFQTPADFLVKASGREISSTVSGEMRTTEFHIEEPIVPTFASAAFHVVRTAGKVPVTMYFLKPRPDLEGGFSNGCASVLGVLQ